MKRFEMVKYGRWQYPADVPTRIAEIAGHFDKCDIYPKQAYSLHTEYSFGSREFNSRYLNGLDIIKTSNRSGIPQLWKNREWAQEFAQFITTLCANHPDPEVIEVHPPFIDYAGSMHQFIEVYKEFEYRILQKYPNVKICLENRCGSRYKSSPFLFSKYTSFIELCEEIQREHLQLRIAFDIPQLFTAEAISGDQLNRMSNCLRGMKMIREYLGSVHLWGKGSIPTRIISQLVLSSPFFLIKRRICHDIICFQVFVLIVGKCISTPVPTFITRSSVVRPLQKQQAEGCIVLICTGVKSGIQHRRYKRRSIWQARRRISTIRQSKPNTFIV